MQKNNKISLPIDNYLPQILELWKNNSNVVVKAGPGLGKTTRLPWYLAKRSSNKVIVLEPRRLAAKLAAQRIASEENLKLGDDVGYHFRFDKNHSSSTKLVFYTEGTFLRHLLNNPELNDIGTIILDEFHERHLETDLALAAIRGVQKKRPELKIILMSATLDIEIKNQFQNAAYIEIEAKQFDVKIHYLDNVPSILNLPLESKIKKTLEKIPGDAGDILVFVPGMREMNKTKNYLKTNYDNIYLLHADLSKEEQEEALRENNTQKIILTTNVAESSITIPGIKFVIDSGVQREIKYSPWTGLKTLEDHPVTQSSAIQRAGRAGRVSHGVCYRLYSEQDFLNREKFTVPEILKADLLDTYLLTTEIKIEVQWFTPPPVERWQKAKEAAYRLGIINSEGKITTIGSAISKYPLDIRLARALYEGERYSQSSRKKLLHYICDEIEKDSNNILKKRLQFYLNENGGHEISWERALLAGFPDQVAKYRPKQHDFIHYSGKTLKLHPSLTNLHHDYYLILDITPRLEAFKIIPIEEEWPYELDPFPFTEEEEVHIEEKFTLKRTTRLGSIPIDEEILKLNWEVLTPLLKNKIIHEGQTLFKKKWEEFQNEDIFLRFYYWARTQGVTIDELSKTISFNEYLNEWQILSWEHLFHYYKIALEKMLNATTLQEDLPEFINLGGKRNLKIHYPFGLDPYIEAPIQDFYGVKSTPTIMRGKVPLTMKLLGPHKRPIQVTRDIGGFWKKTYQEMKKEWQREYPRHHWPDYPENALPILLKRQLDDT